MPLFHSIASKLSFGDQEKFEITDSLIDSHACVAVCLSGLLGSHDTVNNIVDDAGDREK